MSTELRPDPNLTAVDPLSNGQAHAPLTDWTCIDCGAHDADEKGPHVWAEGPEPAICAPCMAIRNSAESAQVEKQIAGSGGHDPAPDADLPPGVLPSASEDRDNTVGAIVGDSQNREKGPQPPDQLELFSYALDRIAEAEKACRDGYREMEQAKKVAKTAKARYEELCGELQEVIAEETGRTTRSLFSPERETKPVKHETKAASPNESHEKPNETPKTGAGCPPADESWRDVPLSSLSLPKGLLDKLASVGIETIGKLQEYQEPSGSGWIKQLTDIKGIGKAAIDKLTAALDHFWAERAKAAPEPATAPETLPFEKPSESTDFFPGGE